MQDIHPTMPRPLPSLAVGDARLDRVVDIERFDMPLEMLFPGSHPAALLPHRHWLEPQFMEGDVVGLSIHSVVLRVADHIILIDACVGEHKPRPQRPSWNERSDSTYMARLAALGLAPENIDLVFCTHLHADHVGWNTVLRNGRWVLTFPNARYLIGRTELAHWQGQLKTEPVAMVNHGSYADSVLPVIEAGQVDLIDSDHEVLNGLTVRPLPGHTPGQVGLSVRRQGQRCLIVGDAIHHPVQLVRPDWSSFLCTDPLRAAATRRGFLDEVAESGDWLVPMHFMGRTGMRIRHAANGFIPEDASRPFAGP